MNSSSTDYLFLSAVSEEAGLTSSECQLILLTHLIPNAPDFLLALDRLFTIKVIIAIPYYIDQDTKEITAQKYPMLFPQLSQLTDKAFILETVKKYIDVNKPFVIQEIGGYFAHVTHELKALYKEHFLGIVEDTEAGHKRYLGAQNTLACPVLSAARSELKIAEDFLIGDSCLRATMHLIRDNHFEYEGKRALVMGFGKIGRATAYAAKKLGFEVSIYDIDPIKELAAFAEGFNLGEREKLIRQSDYIFGATANFSIDLNKDRTHLKDQVKLISCSSKKLEFNVCGHEFVHYADKIDLIQLGEKKLFVFAGGQPINFIGDFLIGPMIRVVHAELMLALYHLLSNNLQPGLTTIPASQKQLIARLWLNHFSFHHS